MRMNVLTNSLRSRYTLHEKCPYLKFFWSVFSPNAGKHGPEKLRIRTLFTQGPHILSSKLKRDLFVDTAQYTVKH